MIISMESGRLLMNYHLMESTANTGTNQQAKYIHSSVCLFSNSLSGFN